jgi:rod shape-determining protein MreC
VKGYRYAVLVVLGAAFLIAFNLPQTVSRPLRSLSREAMAPFQGALRQVADAAADLFRGLVRAGALARERDRLAQELAAGRAASRRLDAVERENAELRRWLGFAAEPNRCVPSEVIAREDGSGWWQTIRLNRGRLDGVGTNQPVVTLAGLVGRTQSVSARSCDVLLISDPNCRVAVEVERTGTPGILSGGGVSVAGRHEAGFLCPMAPCAVEYLDKDAPVQVGDAVRTSGLGGVYPPGILVGQVSRLYTNASRLYLCADVRPAADLARLRRVAVLLPDGARQPARRAPAEAVTGAVP